MSKADGSDSNDSIAGPEKENEVSADVEVVNSPILQLSPGHKVAR
jgi:hypothetical protein